MNKEYTQIIIGVSKKLRARITVAAKNEEQTKSAWVRSLILKELDKQHAN